MIRKIGVCCAAVTFVLVACVVEAPRDPATEDEEVDAGTKKRDAGQLDAGIEDAGVEDAGTEDAGVDAGHPAVPESWGRPQPITSVNTSKTETHPSMSGDLLRLCFMSDRAGSKEGSQDIWCAFRDTVDQPFGVPVNQGNLNTKDLEWVPCLSDDGLELYFSSDRLQFHQMNIFHAVWIPQVGAYGSPEWMSELNSNQTQWSANACQSKDGLSIYFESGRPGGYGDMDIYVATRNDTASIFDAPLNFSVMNSGYGDIAPSVSPDQKTLVFGSGRAGSQSGFFRSEQNSSGVWSTPTPVVIEGYADFNFKWLSTPRILSDGSLLFAGTSMSGNDDLYIAPPKW